MAREVSSRLSALALPHPWTMVQGMDREPVYCNSLGLAVEHLKDGNTIEQLWSVL